MVQASRPPVPSFSYDWVKTSIELDIERQIVASVLSLATLPARSKLAGMRFEQAELRAAEETLRLAAETRRAYIRAVAARQIVHALDQAKGRLRPPPHLERVSSRRPARSISSTMPNGKYSRPRWGASDGGASAGGRSRGAAHPADGAVETDLAALLPSALPALARFVRAISARSSSRRWTAELISQWRGSKSKRLLGPSGSRAKRGFINVLDARRHRPRRKRTKASLLPTVAASTSPSRYRSTISAERECVKPSSVTSRR